MFDFSGVSGLSEYVVYNTLSVQDGVLWELSRQRLASHRNASISRLPVFVNFANPVLVRALQKQSVNEFHEDRRPEDKTGRANLELPEVALPQTHKHGALLLLHPQLIILLQLLPLALVIECRDQGTMIFWSA